MTAAYRHCTLCDAGSTIEQATEVASVGSNVRRLAGRRSTVWRCRICGCLHALEDIDFVAAYADYPLQRQRLDLFARRMYRARLSMLAQAGLQRSHSVLDYGCGSGAFVQFLRHAGFQGAVGYDPYSPGFSDPAILEQTYDVVVAQDVIEHDQDPRAFLERIARLVVRPGGLLAIGTPDATEIDLSLRMDRAGQLHQPFHRHLLTRDRLTRLIECQGFRVTHCVRRWYVDTWFPFCNSSFLIRYWVANGGFVDSSFEPINGWVFLRHPSLLGHGVLGRLWAPRKDVCVFAVGAHAATAA